MMFLNADTIFLVVETEIKLNLEWLPLIISGTGALGLTTENSKYM
jgi:hypothetical protein